MEFQKPLYLGEIPGRANHFIVLEQHSGRVMRCAPQGASHVCGEFLKLSVRQDVEMGLLGFAFHPDFASNRKYYVHYNPASGARRTLIEERRFASDMSKDSGETPRKILELTQPASNHNAGQILFGPDGYFYIPLGDGGGSNRTPQDPSTFYGSVLRVDVDKPQDGKGYGIPADNPFVGKAGAAPETFAYGFRNPYKSNFDPLTGDLWTGDVGDNDWEEINIVEAGGNYGWNRMEGNKCLSGNCSAFKRPVTVIPSDSANAIVGGIVYRANQSSAFYGVYIFADYVQRHIWGLRQKDGVLQEKVLLGRAPDLVSSLEQDSRGNVYAVGYGGKVYRLVHEELKPSTTALPNQLRRMEQQRFLSLSPNGGLILSPQWRDKAEGLAVYRADGTLESLLLGPELRQGAAIRLGAGVRHVSIRTVDGSFTQTVQQP